MAKKTQLPQKDLPLDERQSASALTFSSLAEAERAFAELQARLGNLQAENDALRVEQAENDAAEDSFGTFVELSSDGIALVDENYQLTAWNRALVRLTGISQEEALGLFIWEVLWRLLPPEKKQIFSPDKMREHILNSLRFGPSHTVEATICATNGELRTVLQSKFAIPGKGGKCFGTIIHDISQVRASQVETEKNLMLYRLLAQYSSDGVSLMDSRGVLTYVSPAYLSLLGYEESETIGIPLVNILDRIHPDDREKIMQVMKTARQERIPTSFYEFRARKKNGEYIWLEDHVRREFDEQGHVLRSVINTRNITERKQAELQVFSAHELSQATIDALAHHICVLDENGTIISVNHAWKKFADENGANDPNYFIGRAYLTPCDPRFEADCEMISEVEKGLLSVLRGQAQHFSIDYPCDLPNEKAWFSLRATRFGELGAHRIVVSHENITRRKLAEAEIRASEMKYRGLFTNAQDAILIADDRGRYTDVNPQACNLLGYSREEMLELSIWNLTPEGNMDSGLALWKEFIAMGEQQGEYLVTRKDGKKRTFDYHAVANIVPGMHLAVMRDVTEQRRAENALEVSERHLADIINSAQDAIVSIDGSQIITLVNPAAETMFGYTAAEMLGQPLNMLIPERYRSVHAGHVAAYDQASREHPAMFGLIHAAGVRASGEEFPIETSISQANLGQNNSYTVIVRDITERKQMEARLQESEARFRTLVEATHDMIGHVDAQGHITYLNPAGLRVMECETLEDIVGKHYTEFVAPEYVKTAQTLLAQAIHTKQSDVYVEYLANTRKGRQIWLSQDTQLGYDENMQYAGFQFDARDITDLKQAQESLTLAHDQAVKASKLKSQLIARVSHELRTPLNSILGFAELLKYDIFGELNNAEQKEAVDQIVDSAHYLADMVNEFLDEAEIESKSLVLHQKPFSVENLLKQVEATLSILAEKKGLAFTATLDSALPETMLGDERRLQQILINLANNAIKFTARGEVSIRVARHSAGHWMFHVKDTGVGIPKDAQELIFEPFKQVDNAITRDNRGTGLGLTITRQLVQLMDGRIMVESVPGQGSTFTVILPIQTRSKTE